MPERVFNFSAGPAVLPLPVLKQAQEELLSLPGVGISILEISHRSKTFSEIIAAAEENIKRLYSIPEGYRVLMLQGGSRLQFSMVPMNLMRGSGKSADYVLTGSWGKKAREEAQKEGTVHVAWDGKDGGYNRVPAADEMNLDPNAAYVHITTNETIEGVQFPNIPDTRSVPLVADCSSDIFCRPVPIERFGIIYACAQKNAGPAGVTVVIIREDLLARSDASLPGYLNYSLHAKNDSCYNTPPTFAVYMVNLIAKWLLDDIGGLDKMEAINREKAGMLYDAIDASSGFYRGHARTDCRSMMNVTFRLPSDELQDKFLQEAQERNLYNLKGHRSVGGIRASIYNAMPREGVETLRDFMKDFLAENAS